MTRTRRLPSWVEALYLHDALSIAFLLAMSLVGAIAAPAGIAALTALINTVCCISIVWIADRDHRAHRPLIDAVHRYYIVVLIFALFKEIYILLPFVNPAMYDSLLIAVDRTIFGVNPTQWLAQFSTPLLVEALQITYASFYFIMLAVAIELVVTGRDVEYERYSSAIAYGFFLSYIGYMILPAVGPRFTLHDFAALDRELPGLWVTETVRGFINGAESISTQASNAIATAQRDAFPSGHTEMTLIAIAYAWSCRVRIRWWVTAFGAGLIAATVFLRYHYVIDIVGGLIFFLFTIWTLPMIERWWRRVTGAA